MKTLFKKMGEIIKIPKIPKIGLEQIHPVGKDHNFKSVYLKLQNWIFIVYGVLYMV